MPKKPKLTLWNKKSGKFLPSKFLKPRSSEKSIKPSTATIDNKNKLKLFVKNLDDQIRKAAKGN